jgi:hypothetical protein
MRTALQYVAVIVGVDDFVERPSKRPRTAGSNGSDATFTSLSLSPSPSKSTPTTTTMTTLGLR